MTAALCAFGTTRKLVITYRGSDLNPTGAVSPLRASLGHLLSQLSALRASRIVCVSDELRARLWWRKKDAVMIPSPVDTSVFYPMTREDARQRLGWSQSERVVLFNAGTDPVGKGLDVAEEAVRIAGEEVGPIRLHVMRGEVEPGLVPLYINASDCVLLASRWEGSPNIVKEALACNTPVVGVRAGDVAVRLKGVQPSGIANLDPADLGRALVDVLRVGGRSNGREKLCEVLVETTTRRLVALYSDLLG
jgi:glycosyltransferase involved in cell wall biosynthesis